MVDLTRRTLFKVSAGLAAGVIADSLFARLSLQVAAQNAADFSTLRERWVDIVTGRAQVIPTDSRFSTALLALDTRVSAWQEILDATGTSVFTDLVLTGPNPDAQGVRAAQKIRQSYVRLLDFALAWATPGSAHFGSATVLSQVSASLDTLSAAGYSAGTAMAAADNWWDWQVGSPRALASILAIVADHVPAAQVADGCAAIDHFIPDPWMLDPHKGLPVKESTGANRVDMCQAVVVRSLLDSDATRLNRARAGLAPVWTLVLSGDGFYADGSMLQHTTVPYTGSYGVELLLAASRLFALLDLGGNGPDYEAFFALVEQSYLPLVYRGRVMDSVRGRAIARPTGRSQDAGFAMSEGMLLLATAAPSALAAQIRGRVRSWLDEDAAGRIFTTGTIARTGLVVGLLSSSVPATAEPDTGTRIFNSMARSVIRRPGHAFAVSASSSRIAWYECSSLENIRGYHTGSGMTYLYDQDVSQYDDEFWPTVDRTRLAGTTVEQLMLPDRIGGTSGKGCPPGEWAGGSAVLGDAMGAASVFAQHFVAPHDRNGPGGAFRGSDLRARKAWFEHAGVLVALGADISSTTGGIVETTVENRNLHANGTHSVRVDGVVRIGTLPSSRTENATGPLTVHIDGVGGYYFPVGGSVKMKREERTGAWSDINLTPGIDSAPIARRYLTLWLWHGQNFSGRSYQYAVLPGYSLAETQAFGSAPGFTVIENSDIGQAVRFAAQAARLFAFWKPATIDGLTVNAPCTVAMCTEVDGTVRIRVDQHTALSVPLVVEIAGVPTASSSVCEGGTVAQAGSITTITMSVGSSQIDCALSF